MDPDKIMEGLLKELTTTLKAMSKAKTIGFRGRIHHVITIGLNRQDIFLDD